MQEMMTLIAAVVAFALVAYLFVSIFKAEKLKKEKQ